ncbi:hypothetical protein [Providencia stuartii]|uniref:hypothetical protein n=1 Tax=Providencia stuartii TaxID=588 RepID=UPI0023AE9206|nr:hypothetical protein [Providencia thailandensis]MDE8747560.1 hypothetical protein [Providencia thailandensis]MDE8766566.1 hypothetical protein [Providencia thailandensis]MDE8778619.1 hypothetical protein [Providencia thailandensis]MDE8783031.1 hypothetical protein [Providencia thailandensis]MDE8787025.1 hypothetical protein [Providencia thailandensis]
MSNFDQLMNKGKELEAKKLYRRAAEQYNKALFIAEPPIKGAMSEQQKLSSQAARRCLDKAKIKIPESCL